MAMKYIQLWSMAHGAKRFRWQWAVTYEVNFGDPSYWVKVDDSIVCENRYEARRFIRGITDASHRNIKLKRRLVQSNWEDYTDSFTWNRKRS